MAESDLEMTMAFHIRAYGLPPALREFQFHPERKWRFDFAWPSAMIAVEVEGGVWRGGRHTRGSGFHADCDKYNAAALIGWRVFRFTEKHINSGAAVLFVRSALSAAGRATKNGEADSEPGRKSKTRNKAVSGQKKGGSM